LQDDNWPTTNWKTDPPEAQRTDSTALARIDDYIMDAFPTLLSLLIVRHGSLVFEQYYQGLGTSWPLSSGIQRKRLKYSLPFNAYVNTP
jgi:hypothetical protein